LATVRLRQVPVNRQQEVFLVSKQLKTIICQRCGNSFQVSAQDKREANRRYCSHKCYIASGGRKATFVDWVCDTCGKSFQMQLGKFGAKCKHHFCCKECEHTWRKGGGNPSGPDHPEYNSIEVPCATCGKILVRPKWRIEGYQEQFCSRQCAGKARPRRFSESNHPRWKGGDIHYYGPNWQRQAAAARGRDGFKCRSCGISQAKVGRKLDVHHVVPFRSFGYVPGENETYRQANKLSNLVTLCPSCHQLTESGKKSVQLSLLAGD